MKQTRYLFTLLYIICISSLYGMDNESLMQKELVLPTKDKIVIRKLAVCSSAELKALEYFDHPLESLASKRENAQNLKLSIALNIEKTDLSDIEKYTFLNHMLWIFLKDYPDVLNVAIEK